MSDLLDELINEDISEYSHKAKATKKTYNTFDDELIDGIVAKEQVEDGESYANTYRSPEELPVDFGVIPKVAGEIAELNPVGVGLKFGVHGASFLTQGAAAAYIKGLDMLKDVLPKPNPETITNIKKYVGDDKIPFMDITMTEVAEAEKAPTIKKQLKAVENIASYAEKIDSITDLAQGALRFIGFDKTANVVEKTIPEGVIAKGMLTGISKGIEFLEPQVWIPAASKVIGNITEGNGEEWKKSSQEFFEDILGKLDPSTRLLGEYAFGLAIPSLIHSKAKEYANLRTSVLVEKVAEGKLKEPVYQSLNKIYEMQATYYGLNMSLIQRFVQLEEIIAEFKSIQSKLTPEEIKVYDEYVAEFNELIKNKNIIESRLQRLNEITSSIENKEADIRKADYFEVRNKRTANNVEISTENLDVQKIPREDILTLEDMEKAVEVKLPQIIKEEEKIPIKDEHIEEGKEDAFDEEIKHTDEKSFDEQLVKDESLGEYIEDNMTEYPTYDLPSEVKAAFKKEGERLVEDYAKTSNIIDGLKEEKEFLKPEDTVDGVLDKIAGVKKPSIVSLLYKRAVELGVINAVLNTKTLSKATNIVKAAMKMKNIPDRAADSIVRAVYLRHGIKKAGRTNTQMWEDIENWSFNYDSPTTLYSGVPIDLMAKKIFKALKTVLSPEDALKTTDRISILTNMDTHKKGKYLYAGMPLPDPELLLKLWFKLTKKGIHIDDYLDMLNLPNNVKKAFSSSYKAHEASFKAGTITSERILNPSDQHITKQYRTGDQTTPIKVTTYTMGKNSIEHGLNDVWDWKSNSPDWSKDFHTSVSGQTNTLPPIPNDLINNGGGKVGNSKSKTYPIVTNDIAFALNYAKEIKPMKFFMMAKTGLRTLLESGEGIYEVLTRRWEKDEKIGKVMLEEHINNLKSLRNKLKSSELKEITSYALSMEANKNVLIANADYGIKGMDFRSLSKEAQNAFTTMQDMAAQLYEKINTVRDRNGLKMFPLRQNYFPHILSHHIATQTKYTFGLSEMPEDVFIKANLATSVGFKHGKRRSNKQLYEIELNPFQAFEDYYRAAINALVHTEHVAQLNYTLKNGYYPPEDLVKVNSGAKNVALTSLLENKPNLHKYIATWINDVAGWSEVKLTGIAQGIKTIADHLVKNPSIAILAGSTRTALLNLFSWRLIPPEIIKHIGLVNSKSLFTFRPFIQGYMEALYYNIHKISNPKADMPWKDSLALASRDTPETIAFTDKTRSSVPLLDSLLFGDIKRLRDDANFTLLLGMKLADQFNAHGTWLAFYKVAEFKKMPHIEAVRFADICLKKIQSTSAKTDVSVLGRHPLFRHTIALMNYAISEHNYIMETVGSVLGKNPKVDKLTGVKMGISLIITTALINVLFNDLFDMRSPYPTPLKDLQESIDRKDPLLTTVFKAVGALGESLNVPQSTSIRFGRPFFGIGDDIASDILRGLVGQPHKEPIFRHISRMFAVPIVEPIYQVRKNIDMGAKNVKQALAGSLKLTEESLNKPKKKKTIIHTNLGKKKEKKWSSGVFGKMFDWKAKKRKKKFK